MIVFYSVNCFNVLNIKTSTYLIARQIDNAT